MSDRLEEIHQTVVKIEKILIGERGDNGLCGRMGKIEVRQESTQTELTEHKSNHWQSMAILVAIVGVVITAIELIKG